MSKLHIGIPELDDRKLSYEEFFRIIHVMLRYKTFYLKELYPSNNIGDLNSYPLLIVEKIIKVTRTLHSVINRDRDYVVANIIVRSLADYVSSLSFIYTDTDQSVKTLRHYLFVMDGLKGRIKDLSHDMKYDGRIKEEEFNRLKKQINDALNNYRGACDFAQKQIQQLQLYQENSVIIDEYIKTANWRFKDFGRKTKSYTWKELYDYIKLPINTAFFSSLSEFVHGLSSSNLTFGEDYENFEPLLSIATSLLGKVSKMLDTIYIEDISSIQPKMIEALYDEDIPRHYIEHILRSFQNKSDS